MVHTPVLSLAMLYIHLGHHLRLVVAVIVVSGDMSEMVPARSTLVRVPRVGSTVERAVHFMSGVNRGSTREGEGTAERECSCGRIWNGGCNKGESG